MVYSFYHWHILIQACLIKGEDQMKRVSNVTVKKRMIAVFFLSLLFFIIMSIRLGYVQFIIGNDLVSLATDSWSRDVDFEPERGKIIDANGEVIVDNVSAPSLVVVPRQIDNPEKVAKELSEILEMSYDKAYDNVTKNASMQIFNPEGRKLSDKKVAEIRKLNLDGVYLAKDAKRHYPFDDRLSHVLGFTGIDNQGLMGLELYYDDLLKGDKGSLSFYADAKGQRIKWLADQYRPPTDGLDLQTSIDNRVQTIIERELDLAEEKYSPDGMIAIAVNPKTGGVLGMSSRPNFQPENYQKYDAEIFDRNLPIWSTYEPGSTFKIITLAAAIEEDIVDLEDDRFNDKGHIEVGGAKLRCWKSGGHGEQSFLEVVENSCNPGFVHLGSELGKERLFSYIHNFGFGKKTGIDLNGEGSGILFDEDQVGPVELGTTSFGQGISVTPIQQVMAVSAVVNGGYLYKPQIAEKWIDPETGEVVQELENIPKRSVISEETSAEVNRALESVVAKGTGRPAFVEGYRVGGKTGTAQKIGPDGRYMKNNYIVSFIGFAPADDPEIVIYLGIDNPKGTIQFGGVVSAPIVGTMIGDSLQAMGIEPRTDGLEKEHQWPEEPPIEVPDLIGLNKKELTEYMTTLRIDIHGEGDYIIDQEPKAGTKVEADSTVRIYLSRKK